MGCFNCVSIRRNAGKRYPRKRALFWWIRNPCHLSDLRGPVQWWSSIKYADSWALQVISDGDAGFVLPCNCSCIPLGCHRCFLAIKQAVTLLTASPGSPVSFGSLYLWNGSLLSFSQSLWAAFFRVSNLHCHDWAAVNQSPAAATGLL